MPEFCLLQVYNKIDQVSIEEVDRLARTPNSVVVRYTFRSLIRSFSKWGDNYEDSVFNMHLQIRFFM